PGPPGHRGQDRDRHRHPPRPPGQRGVRRAHRHRLRRDREPGQRAALDAGGRRRGDRDRVRLQVRGPRHQGHRGRAARADARVLRRRGGRGAQVPPARPRGHLPVRGDGVLGRGPPGGGHRDAAEREEDPGRQGASDYLNLDAAGLTADKRGRIAIGESYQTSVPHIYAVGDVIGFPALAATSMEQGRVAAHHACGEPLREVSELQPIGIYSIPEISFVGRTEEQLTHDNVPFEVGVSRYRELARGQIIGDSYGVLKLLVSLDTHNLLGVHVFGTGATELVHIGQAVMGCGGTVDYLVDAVFNYPTLAEAYKVAALDAMNKMRQIARFA